MAAIVWTDVTDEAPELATGVSVNAQTLLLAHANTKILIDGEEGNSTKLARIFWVAHTATLLKRRGMAGTRTSQSAGPVSESTQLLQLPWLLTFSTTAYGILYAQIAKSSPAGAGQLINRRVFPAGGGWGTGGSGWGC